MKRFIILILISLAFLFITRGVAPSIAVERTYRIARDPSWYPFNLRGKEKSVTAFSDELLQRMAREEQVRVEMISAPWDTLVPLMEKGSCDAILTGVTPTRRFTDRYLFSVPYLLLGPVLVVREGSPIKRVSDLQELRLGVQRGQAKGFIMPQNSRLDIQMYDDLGEALEDLIERDLEGVIMDALAAHIAEKGYYRGQVKVVTEPLNDIGLRMMTLQGDNEELIQSFNSRLEDYQKRGIVDELAEKWGVFR